MGVRYPYSLGRVRVVASIFAESSSDFRKGEYILEIRMSVSRDDRRGTVFAKASFILLSRLGKHGDLRLHATDLSSAVFRRRQQLRDVEDTRRPRRNPEELTWADMEKMRFYDHNEAPTLAFVSGRYLEAGCGVLPLGGLHEGRSPGAPGRLFEPS